MYINRNSNLSAGVLCYPLWGNKSRYTKSSNDLGTAPFYSVIFEDRTQHFGRVALLGAVSARARGAVVTPVFSA